MTFTIALSRRASVTHFKFSHATCFRLRFLTDRAVCVGPRLQPQQNSVVMKRLRGSSSFASNPEASVPVSKASI